MSLEPILAPTAPPPPQRRLSFMTICGAQGCFFPAFKFPNRLQRLFELVTSIELYESLKDPLVIGLDSKEILQKVLDELYTYIISNKLGMKLYIDPTDPKMFINTHMSTPMPRRLLQREIPRHAFVKEIETMIKITATRLKRIQRFTTIPPLFTCFGRKFVGFKLSLSEPLTVLTKGKSLDDDTISKKEDEKSEENKKGPPSKRMFARTEILFTVQSACEISLDAIIRKREKIDVKKLFYDVRPFIDACHSMDIVGLDIKLDNIVKCGDTYKMIDYEFVSSKNNIGGVVTLAYYYPMRRYWLLGVISPDDIANSKDYMHPELTDVFNTHFSLEDTFKDPFLNDIYALALVLQFCATDITSFDPVMNTPIGTIDKEQIETIKKLITQALEGTDKTVKKLKELNDIQNKILSFSLSESERKRETPDKPMLNFDNAQYESTYKRVPSTSLRHDVPKAKRAMLFDEPESIQHGGSAYKVKFDKNNQQKYIMKKGKIYLKDIKGQYRYIRD